MILSELFEDRRDPLEIIRHYVARNVHVGTELADAVKQIQTPDNTYTGTLYRGHAFDFEAVQPQVIEDLMPDMKRFGGVTSWAKNLDAAYNHTKGSRFFDYYGCSVYYEQDGSGLDIDTVLPDLAGQHEVLAPSNSNLHIVGVMWKDQFFKPARFQQFLRKVAIGDKNPPPSEITFDKLAAEPMRK